MGGCNHMMETLEEENLIAAANLILRALDSNTKLTNETRKIFSDLGTRLTSITMIAETEPGNEDGDGFEEANDIKLRINSIQEKIMAWEDDESMIWDCDPEEAKEYLKTVDEARRLSERLESLNLSNHENELLRNVYTVLQTSMARIEEEFTHILVHNKQSFEPEHFSFRSIEDDGLDANSVVSFGDDSVDDSVNRDSVSVSRGAEVSITDMVNPQVIPDLKSIADMMFAANYGRECSQAFIHARKDALDDCLFVLEVEKLSIEDVLKMDWVTLNSKIKRWIKAIRIFIRVYLASEKCLCEQIFGQKDSYSSICFSESSKASILQLLNFAEAISIGPHQPEKLLRILDMYEALSDLMPDIEGLYADENGSFVKTEFQDVLLRVGDCVKATFIEFENAVGSNASTNPLPGGGNHPLTSYVMNYVKTLTDYSDELNVCLKDNGVNDESLSLSQDSSSSPDTNSGYDEDTINGNNSYSPISLHFRSLMSILECNLEEKSKLYKDDALGHIFMMNNINYMAEKVMTSELRNVLGDDWIRKRNWKFQQYAMSYERATWSSILNFLKEDGISNSGSSGSTLRTLLRERLQAFYSAFEEIYKSQTGWVIRNSQLRDDLKISISLKVIQAYRTFVGRHTNNISEKYIKYTADDLENYILDLFEGTAKPLHSLLKK